MLQITFLYCSAYMPHCFSPLCASLEMRVCASLDKTPGKSVRRNTEKGIETDKQGRLDSVAYRGGIWGVQTPPEILKALQNCSKLNPIVKTVKKC